MSSPDLCTIYLDVSAPHEADISTLEPSHTSMSSAETSEPIAPRGDVESHSNPGEKEKVDELRDPIVVDWDGPDDPVNPLNWPAMRKATMIGVVSFITFLSYASQPYPRAHDLIADSC